MHTIEFTASEIAWLNNGIILVEKQELERDAIMRSGHHMLSKSDIIEDEESIKARNKELDNLLEKLRVR